MPLPSHEAARKTARMGLFYVCARCPKWGEGVALGLGRCTGKDCGSPIRRKDFPEYAGESFDFSSVCFACGDEEVLAFAKVWGSERKFGLCRKHLEIVDDLIERKDGIVNGQDRKVFILPNPARVMSQFRDSRVTL
jgi:hypothetical protein